MRPARGGWRTSEVGRARKRTAVAVGAAIALQAHPAFSDARFVDDPAVAGARHVEVRLGAGAARFLLDGAGTRVLQWGSGANLEETVGLGGQFEIGARFGVRLDDIGAGLRADEVARGFGPETFGTGIDPVANPELRVKRQALSWPCGEAGAEARLVLPIKPEPTTTGVLGAWITLRVGRIARLDAGIDLVVAGQHVAGGNVVQPALGIPVRLWAMMTSHAYAGLMTNTQAFAGTRYVDGRIREVVGLGAGYRLGSWDATLIAESLDATTSLLGRTGLGLEIAWRL